MIISIRFVYPSWHWEIFAIGKEASHADSRYAQGINDTWKGMMSAIEPHISELERMNETRKSNRS